jgi:hypothetical protein
VPSNLTDLQKDTLKSIVLAVSESEEWHQATIAADIAYQAFSANSTEESSYREACSRSLQMSLDGYALIAYCHALQAQVVKDHITPDEYSTLVTPWQSVMGSNLLREFN